MRGEELCSANSRASTAVPALVRHQQRAGREETKEPRLARGLPRRRYSTSRRRQPPQRRQGLRGSSSAITLTGDDLAGVWAFLVSAKGHLRASWKFCCAEVIVRLLHHLSQPSSSFHAEATRTNTTASKKEKDSAAGRLRLCIRHASRAQQTASIHHTIGHSIAATSQPIPQPPYTRPRVRAGD